MPGERTQRQQHPIRIESIGFVLDQAHEVGEIETRLAQVVDLEVVRPVGPPPQASRELNVQQIRIRFDADAEGEGRPG